jgi:hypothetical protein
MRNLSEKAVQKIQTHILCSVTIFFSKNRAVCKIKWKNVVQSGNQKWQYGARALHAGYLRLQTHTHTMQYLLLFHYNSGCTNAPQCYVTVQWAFGKWSWGFIATGNEAASLADWHQVHSDAVQCPRSIQTSKQDIYIYNLRVSNC